MIYIFLIFTILSLVVAAINLTHEDADHLQFGTIIIIVLHVACLLMVSCMWLGKFIFM